MPQGPPYYFTPQAKWTPIYTPPKPWQVIGANGAPPKVPEGQPVNWWLLPKSDWPYKTPFAPKVFGAMPASKISMPPDLKGHPPLGYIKVKMKGQEINAGQQIAFSGLKIHMRHLTPRQLGVMAVTTLNSVKYYFRNQLQFVWDRVAGKPIETDETTNVTTNAASTPSSDSGA